MKLILKLGYYQSISIIGLVCLIVFASFNGQSHLFDWDEINFAEAAREMIVSGNYSVVQINYEPFWEKPPLFFWLQAICMKVFGISEFSARLPNAIAGSITGMLLFSLGKKNINNIFGWLWALAFCTSLLPILYFKSGIIDPWFNLFIFYGIYAFWKALYKTQKPIKWAIISGSSIGLGIMTKGPVALLILALVFGVFIIWKKFKVPLSLYKILGFSLSLFLVGGLWFFIEWISGRGYIIQDFIDYQIRLLETQDAGHGGPFYYHFIVLLFGCFPMSVFALNGFSNHFNDQRLVDFQKIMAVLLIVVLLLFSIVNTKIIHYSSLCYFPISFFAANFLHKAYKKQIDVSWVQKLAFNLVGIVLLFAFFALPYLGNNIDLLQNATWIEDAFAKANFNATNTWTYLDYGLPCLFLLGILSFYFTRFFKKYLCLMLISAASYLIIMIAFVPKIEAYTQRTSVAFYKSKKNEDCYVVPMYFKSYAHLYYTNKRPQKNPKHTDLNWLINEETDKPVYVILKNTETEKFAEKNSTFRLLYQKNGFAFFKKIQ